MLLEGREGLRASEQKRFVNVCVIRGCELRGEIRKRMRGADVRALEFARVCFRGTTSWCQLENFFKLFGMIKCKMCTMVDVVVGNDASAEIGCRM
mgnify:CR=1 FL=1